MGIGQVSADADFCGLGAITKGGPQRLGDADKRAHALRLNFIIFVIPGGGLTVFVAPDRGGHFFLGRGYRR